MADKDLEKLVKFLFSKGVTVIDGEDVWNYLTEYPDLIEPVKRVCTDIAEGFKASVQVRRSKLTDMRPTMVIDVYVNRQLSIKEICDFHESFYEKFTGTGLGYHLHCSEPPLDMTGIVLGRG